MGINAKKIYAYTMGIAAVTAAISGVLVGMTFTFYPHSGTQYLIIAFGVVIIGGLGSLPGTFLGGLVLGVSQLFGGRILGPGFQLLSGYIILLIILTIRPQMLGGGSILMQANRTRLILIVVLLAFLAILPLWASRYVVNVGLLVCLYVTLASMWNLLAGYSGMVSLGQQMFIGLGGYTLAVSSVNFGVPIYLSVLFGGFMSVILPVLISMSVFRMKGVYFAIGTWVIAEALGICFSNWGYVKYGMGMFIQPAYKLSMSGVCSRA